MGARRHFRLRLHPFRGTPGSAQTQGDSWGDDHGLDPESKEWLRALSASGVDREEAIALLHALLLRATRYRSCASISPSAGSRLPWERTDPQTVAAARLLLQQTTTNIQIISRPAAATTAAPALAAVLLPT